MKKFYLDAPSSPTYGSSPMGGPEANLVRRILAELNSWKYTRAIKTHSMGYGRAGQPDILGSRYGKIFLLEIKVPGKKPTPRQTSELARWREAGAIAEWYDNFDAAIKRVRDIGPMI